MGKPYLVELERLAKTYEESLSLDIGCLVGELRECWNLPLLSVGSGGSFTAAHFAASLHQSATGRLAKAVTPLETRAAPCIGNTAVLFISAEGKNPDILGSFRMVAESEPRRLFVLCATLGSPLAQVARRYAYAHVVEWSISGGKDGFLATNSLLSNVVLLARAYAHLEDRDERLPSDLKRLLHPTRSLAATLNCLERATRLTSPKETLLLLYGPTCQGAAIDLESKFSEAALSNLNATDYRSFAHGRHHWLHKRGDSTGIAALISPDDEELARRTLRLVPATIPVTEVSVPYAGARGAVAALVFAFYIVHFAGRARGMDPGRPQIPPFGRKLYHLKAFRSLPLSAFGLSSAAAAAIRRKAGKDINSLAADGKLKTWRRHFRDFVRRLRHARFTGLILDYDGTLCRPEDRFTGLRQDVAQLLNSLLSAGLRLGIATGRGKSARDELRSKIARRHWRRISVGFYNCSDIGALDDDSHPDSISLPTDQLVPVAQAIRSHQDSLPPTTYRKYQITLDVVDTSRAAAMWEAVGLLCMGTGVTLVRSSHSIDILAPGISKTNLIAQVRQQAGGSKVSRDILIIGDLGRWPGNDAGLLSNPFALSVDEVSSDPYTCWNIAHPGHRGVQAALDYLRALTPQGDGLVLNAHKLGVEA